MTGVSASGKAIFEVEFTEGSGDRNIISMDGLDLAGLPFFAGFSIGNGGSSWFRTGCLADSGSNSMDFLFGRPLVGLAVFTVALASSTSLSAVGCAVCDFGGRPLRGECTTGLSTASPFTGGADFSFLIVAREN